MNKYNEACFIKNNNVDLKIFYYYKYRNMKKFARFYNNSIFINIKHDCFKLYNINVNKCFDEKIIDNVYFFTNQCHIVVFIKYVYKNNNIFVCIILFNT